MKTPKHLLQTIIKLLSPCMLLVMTCISTPLNNVFDTQPIFTVMGTDKYYKEKDKGEIRFYITPMYQQTSTVRNADGIKVKAGDRLGAWNMFGFFFGRDAASKTFNGDAANYPHLYPQTQPSGHVPPDPRATVADITGQAVSADSRYRIGANATLEQNFKPEKLPFAYVNVPLNYEKVGLRSQMNFDFGFGLGIAVKGGVVDVKQKFTNFIEEEQFHTDHGYVLRATTNPDAQALYTDLYSPVQRDAIAKDVDLYFTTYRKTAAEDLHLQIYWHFPIDLYDNDGDVAATVVPYLGFGAWMPSGAKSDPNQPFSVPTGNDGFYGFTFDASIGFDFPVLPKTNQTLQLCIGGGFLLFNSKDQTNVRMYAAGSTGLPNTSTNTDYQIGIIPWKTNINRRPGLTWYFNTSLKSEEFLGGLSIYLDYIYTQHLKDSITLQEPNATRKAAFNNGLERYKRDTSWKNQQVGAGMDYKIADNLKLGGAVQAHISGVRVYRATTLLGGITFTF